MNYTFDLTGDRLHRFTFFPDAPDAVAAFSIPNELPDSMSLLVWGVYLTDSEQEPAFCQSLASSAQQQLPTALYLSGWGRLTFEDVRGAEITVSPYRPSFQFHTLELQKDSEGKTISISRRWPVPTGVAVTSYRFSLILEHPLGHGQFCIDACGPVTLDVDPQAFVAEEEVEKFPDEYLYDWGRSRQLHLSKAYKSM